MRIISLGWGVQSFTLAAMAALGETEKVGAAIHADTTHEASGTYEFARQWTCLLYTSDTADERSSVDLGGRRIIKKKNNIRNT